jgi:DNA polymerase-3 subunit delta
MGESIRAVDYLAAPQKHPPRPVCALFGDEAFLLRKVRLALREEVLGAEGDFSLTTFDGRDAELADVLEELTTTAMFGSVRLVAVEQADDFVSRFRQRLEDYVARPSRSGVLALELRSLPSNTRLYKAVAAEGLLVECSAPKGKQTVSWLVDWARQGHGIALAGPAAEMLIEMIGPELGLLDQELAKLAVMAGEGGRVGPELVGRAVGGWRARTAWEMIDTALDGNAPAALAQLDRLLAAGEQPIGVLSQVSYVVRRMAAATRLVLRAEASGRRPVLNRVLAEAGVRSFVLAKTERQLRRLGRQRGARLYRWLLQADLDLKGDSALPPRLILERLILLLAAPQEELREMLG